MLVGTKRYQLKHNDSPLQITTLFWEMPPNVPLRKKSFSFKDTEQLANPPNLRIT